METDKDVFQYIKEFKTECAEVYGLEVEVQIKRALYPKVMISSSKLIEYVEYLFKSDEKVPIKIRQYGLRDKARFDDLILYRQCLFWFLRNEYYTYTNIAAIFKKSHATVIHGVKNINNLLETKDPTTIRIFNRIKDELKKTFNIDGDPSKHQGTGLDT